MTIRTVLSSSNAKFNTGSLSLSFTRSHSPDCDTGCAAWDVCYSFTLESRYGNLDAKLERHEQWGFERVCLMAVNEVRAWKGDHVAWFRFSVHGSVPNRELSATEFKAFRSLLRAIRLHRNPNGTTPKIHFPVETDCKASAWRDIVTQGGLFASPTHKPFRRDHNVVVRASVPNDDFLDGKASHASTVADASVGRDRRKRRLRAAFKLAKARREQTGKTCVVCPSEAYQAKTGQPKAQLPVSVKCGLNADGKGCTLCADPDVSGVVYLA